MGGNRHTDLLKRTIAKAVQERVLAEPIDVGEHIERGIEVTARRTDLLTTEVWVARRNGRPARCFRVQVVERKL